MGPELIGEAANGSAATLEQGREASRSMKVWRGRPSTCERAVKRGTGGLLCSTGERDPTQNIVRERHEQHDAEHLVHSAYPELEHAVSPSVRVDAFGRRAALFVDRLGRLSLHARAPGNHFGRVITAWRGGLTSTRQCARRSQRRVDAGTSALKRGDVIAFDVAAVDQVPR